MYDQADYLRRLVRQDAPSGAGAVPGSPRLVAVMGGKGGVGATSLAINLAVALAQSGQRLLLVDADLTGANIDAQCELREGDSLIDVLQGHRDVHEVLQPGPCGIQVLPGRWAPGEVFDCSPEAQDRLLGQLRKMGKHVEIVLLDVGSGLNPRVRRFVEAVDTLLLVTEPDPVSVMDTYAAIKLLLSPAAPAWAGVAVNQVAHEKEAREVYRRVAVCCRRFLGRTLNWAGSIPCDEGVPLSIARKQPLLLQEPDSPASRSVNSIAASLLYAWETEDRTNVHKVAVKPALAGDKAHEL